MTSYLTHPEFLLQLEIELDIDNNPKTGCPQEGDPWKGADFGIVMSLGMPEGKLKQNAMVGRWGNVASGNPQFAAFAPATPRLTVDLNELRLLVMASPINLRAGKPFRFAAGLFTREMGSGLRFA